MGSVGTKATVPPKVQRRCSRWDSLPAQVMGRGLRGKLPEVLPEVDFLMFSCDYDNDPIQINGGSIFRSKLLVFDQRGSVDLKGGCANGSAPLCSSGWSHCRPKPDSLALRLNTGNGLALPVIRAWGTENASGIFQEERPQQALCVALRRGEDRVRLSRFCVTVEICSTSFISLHP